MFLQKSIWNREKPKEGPFREMIEICYSWPSKEIDGDPNELCPVFEGEKPFSI